MDTKHQATIDALAPIATFPNLATTQPVREQLTCAGISAKVVVDFDRKYQIVVQSSRKQEARKLLSNHGFATHLVG